MGDDPYFNPPPTISITSGPDVSTAQRSATIAFAAPGAAGYRCSIDGSAVVPCNGGTWAGSNLSTNPHVFEVFAVDGNGSAITEPTRWAWTVVPAAMIDVRDFAFSPTSRTIGQDTSVSFRFHGPSSHTVTDTSGMGLFDSGPMPAGTSASVPVVGAGGYPFECSIHPSMTGTLKVGVLASPSSGTTSTDFSVRWAAGQESGFVFDVQVKRPGATAWMPLMTDTQAGSTTFTPDHGAGTYSFRARTQRDGGASTRWSVAKQINVS
jgi:plastocyanin